MDAEALTQKYREAIKQGTQIRVTLTVAIVVVALANVLMIKSRFHDFVHNESHEFVTELGREIANVDPALSQQAHAMLSRLAPVYGDALMAAYDRHRPAAIAAGQAELVRLDEHVQGRWPDIERQLGDIIAQQESALNDHLAVTIPPDRAHEIANLYGEALTTKLNALMEGDLGPHREAAERIGVNLAKLAESAPTPAVPANSREILGVTLELAGLGLQQHAN